MTAPWEPQLPLLPYPDGDDRVPGTQGWQGSETSHERAVAEAQDGTATRRQQQVLAMLRQAKYEGQTWKEVAGTAGWHHGQASGVLSVLHKEGRIARLRDVRRTRCAVYVLPQFVAARATVAQGHKPPKRFVLAASEREALERLRADLNGGYVFSGQDIRQVVSALERAVHETGEGRV